MSVHDGGGAVEDDDGMVVRIRAGGGGPSPGDIPPSSHDEDVESRGRAQGCHYLDVPPGNHHLHLVSDRPRRNSCLGEWTGLWVRGQTAHLEGTRRKRVTALCEQEKGQKFMSSVFSRSLSPFFINGCNYFQDERTFSLGINQSVLKNTFVKISIS